MNATVEAVPLHLHIREVWAQVPAVAGSLTLSSQVPPTANTANVDTLVSMLSFFQN
jgi:hypothetical protein